MENLIRSHLPDFEELPGSAVGIVQEWEDTSLTDHLPANNEYAGKTAIEDGIVHSPYARTQKTFPSLHAFISERLGQHSDRVALMQGDIVVTFKELTGKLRCYAAGFQSYNVGPGDRVYCHCGNSIEAFIALYSIALSGATVVLSDPEYKKGEVEKHMKDIDATHVFTDANHASKFNVTDARWNIKAYFCVGCLPGFISVSDFDAREETDYAEPGCAPDHALVLAYTSGTTGAPKNVEIPEKNFLRKISGMDATSIYTESDVCLACEHLTIYLSFSFNLKFICSGASLVISDKYWSPTEFICTADRYKVSLLMTTPAVLSLLAKAVASTGKRLPSVTKIVSLGAVLPKRTALQVFAAFKPKEFRNVYGLSEASGVICCPPPGHVMFESVGFPVPDTMIKIVDANTGKKLEALTRGEILVHSPNVMRGYYKNSNASAATLDTDGWLRTGDIGYYDRCGRLFVTERAKSVIKCLDTKVEPFEVEQCILEQQCVAEVAVLGVPHPFFGEAPAAIIVLKQQDLRPQMRKDDLRRLAQCLKNHVAERLAVYKQLYGGIAFSCTLPKNKRGKILKRELKAEFEKLQKSGAVY